MMSIPGLDDITGGDDADNPLGDASEAAAGGSAIPGIGTIVGAVGGLAGGLLGMIGGQNQNSANQQAQVQAEQFEETMANTAYQRATADMKAAGINPILAYSQGGAASLGAPTYTATNTLDNFASTAKDSGDLFSKLQEMIGKDASNSLAFTNATTAQGTQAATISQAQSVADTASSDAERAKAAAHVATASQGDLIQSNNAKASKDTADARSANVEAQVSEAGQNARVDTAPYNAYLDTIRKGAASAKDVGEAIGFSSIGKLFKKSPDAKYINKETGEIQSMPSKDYQDMMNQYNSWKRGK